MRLCTWGKINLILTFGSSFSFLRSQETTASLTSCCKQTSLLFKTLNVFPSWCPAAAAGHHLQHHRSLPLLPHLHQPLRHLSGPAPVEVQPLLPGQRWYLLLIFSFKFYFLLFFFLSTVLFLCFVQYQMSLCTIRWPGLTGSRTRGRRSRTPRWSSSPPRTTW